MREICMSEMGGVKWAGNKTSEAVLVAVVM
jgi:hypothetical protein